MRGRGVQRYSCKGEEDRDANRNANLSGHGYDRGFVANAQPRAGIRTAHSRTDLRDHQLSKGIPMRLVALTLSGLLTATTFAVIATVFT